MITTAFDMAVLNDVDRLHLVGDATDRLLQHGSRADYVKQVLRDKLIEHGQCIREHGEDPPKICNWRWQE